MFSRLLVTAPFAFCVITFEPIEVQTCSAPQNDRLNLSFVKDIAENWLEMVKKWPFLWVGGGSYQWTMNTQLFSEGSLSATN